MMPHLARAVVLAAAFIFAAANSYAVNISPIKLEIMPGQRAMQLSVVNTSNEIRTFDVRVKKWDGVDQTNGRSITTEIAGSPILLSRPVLTLPPFAKATIRLSVAERSVALADYYRVFIDDITPIDEEKQTAGDEKANIRISVSLPLQVRNKAGIKGNLVAAEDGTVLVNSGDNIVTILGTTKPDGTLDSSVSRYVMPGEKWTTALRAEELRWLAGIQ